MIVFCKLEDPYNFITMHNFWTTSLFVAIDRAFFSYDIFCENDKLLALFRGEMQNSLEEPLVGMEMIDLWK